MGFLSKLFGGLFGHKDGASKSGASASGALRAFINNSLPKSYTQSKKYALSIQEMAGGYLARITLDMLADGSDYSGMDGQDLRNIAELESGHLLRNCLANPPVSTSFNLEMVFAGGRVITVERRAGAADGILTDQGQRQEVMF